MQYWLITYYPFYSFKKLYNNKEFAYEELKDIIHASIKFWKAETKSPDPKKVKQAEEQLEFIKNSLSIDPEHKKLMPSFQLVAFTKYQKNRAKWYLDAKMRHSPYIPDEYASKPCL